LFLVILITVLALLGVKYFLKKQRYGMAWVASAATIVGATFFGVIGLFPNLFPSSINPSFSLTAYNASSSPLTLTIMLGVVVVFIPIVLAYQAWTYNLFKSKTTPEDLAYEDAY
jgi:cytochrome d ubiquinol oxidase subunit II